MGRERRENHRDQEQEKIQRKGKSSEPDPDYEEDEEDLDAFDTDGFIVDDPEYEEDGEEESRKQAQKKKKRKSLGTIVLDDEDLELIRENRRINQEASRDGKLKRLRKAGVDSALMEYSSNDGGSLFDNIAEADMADFIVDEDVVILKKPDFLREQKLKGIKHSPSLSKGAKLSFGKEGRLEKHIENDQIQSVDPNKYKSFIPADTYVPGEDHDIDIPERMQIIQDIVGSPIDGMSLEEESSWILGQLASNINPLFSEANSCRLVDTAKRGDIISFLELHHKMKYDIPFIAMYRKEQCLSLLEDPKLNDESENISLKMHKMLWIIQELDKKWWLLQKRKNLLMEYYNKHFEEKLQLSFLVEESSFHAQMFDSITNMLKIAETETEIDDIDRRFNLYFPPVEEPFDCGFRRPMTKSYYSNCYKAGLGSLSSKFGDPEKFSSLVTLSQVGTNKEEDSEESPEQIASIYKCETFQTSEAVLKGARHMAAVMLSSEIPFRKYVRTIFMDKALVSTNPTLEGNIAIDSFHEFAGVKWLRDKPLPKFEDSQWLLIQKAEEEKLLQVKIHLPDHTINELTMTCNDSYLKDSEGISTRLWNEQRKLILKDVISNFILPSMEKEARVLLNAKAKNYVLMKYAMQLWNRVSVAPYLKDVSDTVQQKGVMACCWGNGKPGTTFVMLDSGGELVDVMHARSLTLRSQQIIDQQSRKNDQQCILRFLTTYQPDVIVIGASNASCLKLREDINEIISMISEHNFRNFNQGTNVLPTVVLGETVLPRLYEDSEISTRQLPRQDGIVRRAVALGRYLLNPLAMVATLCGEENEIVCWKVTPLEKFLTSDEKLKMIEWVMTDVTNQVGIDINLAVRHEWLLASLQFVSGLGPKKANILCRQLLGGADVRNRRDFAKFGLNTNKIFCNAVGFLRVSCDVADNTLDRTRIHPESYNLSEELARAVYRKLVQENPEADVSEESAIECIQNDPNLLKKFDLNEYADRLEIENGENRRVTLFDIKMELLHGFKDPRRPYTEPTEDEEFCMITGETGDVLVEGKRVEATVRKVLPKQAFCVLHSGMAAVLFKDDFSDGTENISLTEKLREGVVLACKIKLVDKSRCQVNLTCKVSELKNDGDQSFHDMDPYYHEGKTISINQLEGTEEVELGNKHFLPRMISHPNFQNINADQAKQFLADHEVGEYIFHPSSRGLYYLTLSLKICNSVYVHKDIVEGGKGNKLKNLAELGETLKIGEETFENINQVIELYVNPLVVLLKAMLNFRKFKNGTKVEVDERLKHEKDEYPNRIVYGFGVSYEHPGTFILSYIRSTNPHHEFVAIHPKGFKFRKQIFENIELLVAYFQNHINDNVALAKSSIKVGSVSDSLSGGWRNSVGQHSESKAYNDHRGGRGPQRGRRGRGRGFGPRSGSRDDSADDSFAGKSWEVRGSGEGDGGRQGRGRGRGRGRGGRGSQGDTNDGGFEPGQNEGRERGRGRGRGRGRRGSQGSDDQGRGGWGRNNHGSRNRADGDYSDAYKGGDWGQGSDQGRGWRGSQGNDQGCSDWGEGPDQGRGWRGSQGNGQGCSGWGGNNSNEERNEGNKDWGQGNGGSGSENKGWGKNASPSGGGGGWGWTG
ncbi:transcription elongation factor SPT6-like [Vigna umbellata]|uniref:transcription elongation factor SPT6-like n=1 Tax=Vigna umbellata TaxID=87088 RepID=UPI001F5F7F62|nr:transcription elongation factor SPT6-like [Vigna umbellata]